MSTNEQFEGFVQLRNTSKLALTKLIRNTYKVKTSNLFQKLKAMKKLILIPLMFAFSLSVLVSQDIVYSVRAQFNEGTLFLDSILFENITNGSQILFDNLPENPDYLINLSKKQYVGNTGINAIKEQADFIVSQNIPGKLSLYYSKSTPSNVTLSVYNSKGQKIYTSGKNPVHANNTITLELNSLGVFFVKLESPSVVQSFKSIGVSNLNNFTVNISEVNTFQSHFKSAMPAEDPDFSFEIGDSLRITALKTGYYAPSTEIKIDNSQTIDFQFNKNYIRINDHEYLIDGGISLSSDDENGCTLVFLSSEFNFNFENFVKDGSIETDAKGAMVRFEVLYPQGILESGTYNLSTGEGLDTDTLYVDYDLNNDELINELDFYTKFPDSTRLIFSEVSYYSTSFDFFDEDTETKDLQTGTVVVEKNTNSYTIKFDCIGENGDAITGSFSGQLHYYVFGEELTINVIDVESWAPENIEGELVENAIVKLLDRNNPNRNAPLYEGMTNSYGKVIFNKVLSDDYFVYIEKGEKSNLIAKEIINGNEVGYTISGIFNSQEEVDQSIQLNGTTIGDPKLIDTNADGVLSSDDKTFGNMITINGQTEHTFYISKNSK